MLLSVERQVVDGLQSFTVFGLSTPLVSPMYWVRLFCDVFVSVQSLKNEHCVARPCKYGRFVKPRPTFDQVRFSNENTTTWSYFTGGAAVEPQTVPAVPAEPALPPVPPLPPVPLPAVPHEPQSCG